MLVVKTRGFWAEEEVGCEEMSQSEPLCLGSESEGLGSKREKTEDRLISLLKNTASGFHGVRKGPLEWWGRKGRAGMRQSVVRSSSNSRRDRAQNRAADPDLIQNGGSSSLEQEGGQKPWCMWPLEGGGVCYVGR